MTKARDISKLLSTANGKIAGENLDVSFENITDTGTEGTKVASGTSAQRGSTAGQLRFNSDTGLAEYYTGTAFKSIDAPPTISSLDVTEVDSQAGGNQTIVITGGNFASGATVTFVGASGTDFNASTVTVDSVSQITAVAPKASFLNAQEPYGVKVQNTSGLSATLASQINVDTSPSWSTASGTLATITDSATGTHATVSATDIDGDTIVYSETTSVLSGAGLSLNSSTGEITGDPTDVASSTTLTFTLRATANSKTADRSFNIVVNPTPISAYYLMVAGGGAGGSGSADGGYGGGGGGAGGLRTNYGSTAIYLVGSTQYTISVGSGGTQNNYDADSGSGNDGGDTSISGSGFTTILTNGGGAGGSGGNPSAQTGRDGGSGGGAGAGASRSGGSGNIGNFTPSEGNNGGQGHGAGSPYSGGGGGGASQAGTSGQNQHGHGGNGIANSITGSSITYAGGGGGGTWSDSSLSGQASGGSGGGGAGAPKATNSSGTAGTNGLGGGGGGGGQNGAGASGGSGVFILRLPTADYSGTTTGSPTVTTSGSDTIIKWTSSGSYTA